MKKYYNLIGNEVPLESWVLTFKDYPPTYPKVESFEQMLTASSWPVLFYHQIPERFLKEDPGFPILLRIETNQALPDWVYSPLLPDSKNFSGRYSIQTPQYRKAKKVLFTLAHPIELSWEELCQQYPAEEHRWIWNADINSKGKDLPFPEELKLGMGDIIFQKLFTPDLLVDLSFGLLDTYTPIHLFCFHNGSNLELFKALPVATPFLVKDLGHSKWLIFK